MKLPKELVPSLRYIINKTKENYLSNIEEPLTFYGDDLILYLFSNSIECSLLEPNIIKVMQELYTDKEYNDLALDLSTEEINEIKKMIESFEREAKISFLEANAVLNIAGAGIS